MPIPADTIFFSEATSTLAVAARLSKAKKTPLTDALLTVAEQLHAIIKEIRPTQKDWQETIAFLTEVGHASDEKRQEWVLLADLLGLSALVEEINSRRPQGATKNTVRGPFYRSDAPALRLGANISLDGIGEPLTVSGIVQDLDGVRLAGATVETWQANSEGVYENQQPDLQPEFNLRGIFTTNLEGRFYYRTVKPAGYSVPDDGPVGQLLGKIGYPLRRPPHLHFLVKAKGYQSLTTQIFDGNDPHSREDALFGIKEGLLGDFRKIKDGSGSSEWSLDLTFILCAEKPEGGGRR